MSKSRRHERGLLIEYALTPTPLVLKFDFNPSSITRTRTLTVATGGTPSARGGYSFASPLDTPRASQGVNANPESFSFEILLDATDRLAADDPIAKNWGIQPEIDVIRAMLEPKRRDSKGMSDLKVAAEGGESASNAHLSASVLLFKWGPQILPVFMTSARIKATAHLPNLAPYRAEADLTLEVIETVNPFYTAEQARREASARALSSLVGLSAD